MPEIKTIQPWQVAAAKETIYRVAWTIFDEKMTFEEALLHYAEHWPLHDLDDVQKGYFDNGGAFLVTLEGERILGTGGIRRMDDVTCEVKRLWFLPEVHGQGLGYQMLTTLLQIAREMGYTRARLSTSPESQPRAYAFYHKVGFYDIPSYKDDPDGVGMEIIL